MRAIKRTIILSAIVGFVATVLLTGLFPFYGSGLIFAGLSCTAVILISCRVINSQYTSLQDFFSKSIGMPAPPDLPSAVHELVRHIATYNEHKAQMEETLSRIQATCSRQAERVTTMGSSTHDLVDYLARLKGIVTVCTAAIENISSNLETTTSYTEKTTEKTVESAETLAASMEKIKNMLSVVDASHSEIAKLQELTKKIEESTNLIDTIANQTNLLALNASIEAARAGDAGRGFSVVADEVRKLAEHSTHAAKDIDPKILAIREAVTLSVERLTNVQQIAQEIETATKHAAMGASVVMGAISNLENQINSISGSLIQLKGSNNELEKISAACESFTRPFEDSFQEIKLHISEMNNAISDKLLTHTK